MYLPGNNLAIGYTLLISGIVFILSFLFLFLMFTTRRSPWGPLNDISYAIALILLTPVLFSFHNYLRSSNPLLALLAVILILVGILIISITQLRLVFRTIEFELNLRQGAFGSGLLGVGFIIFNLMHLNTAVIPSGSAWLGLFSGILMAMGIPTGLFYSKEELAMTTGQLDWKNTNKLAIVSVSSTFIGQIVLIVWVFWLGIRLITL